MKTTKTEEVAESSDKKPSNLDHFKDQFGDLSIKELRLVKTMVDTTMDLKQARARHEGKVKKDKSKNGLTMPSDPRYAEPDDDYI